MTGFDCQKWTQDFDVSLASLSEWWEVFPSLLCTNEAPSPTLDLIAAAATSASQQHRRPVDSFDHYLELQEFAAAAYVLQQFREQIDSERTQAFNRRQHDARRTYQDLKTEITSQSAGLPTLGVSEDELEDLRLLLQRAESLANEKRLALAIQSLQQAQAGLEKHVNERVRRLQQSLRKTENEIQKLKDPVRRVEANRRVTRARDYIKFKEIRLADEEARNAQIISEGGNLGDSRSANTNSRAHQFTRRDFPKSVTASMIVEWAKSSQPTPTVVGWDDFQANWMPKSWLSTKPTNKDLVFSAVSNIANAKKIHRPFSDSPSDPWRFFLKDLFDLLGHRKHEPTRMQEVVVRFRESKPHSGFYIGFSNRGFQVKGSFLNHQQLPNGLPIIIWTLPRESPLPSSMRGKEALPAYGTPTVVMAAEPVSDAQREQLSRTFPWMALLDEPQLLSIILAGGDVEAAERFVTEVARQFEPTIVNPFRASGWVAGPMFFGRDHELRQFLQPLGPTVIYGGRKLGKSSLLREAHDHFHLHGDGTSVCIYLEIRNAGRTPGTAARVLRQILDELCHPADGVQWRNDGATGRGGFASYLAPTEDPVSFSDQILSLVRRFPQHRFLVLLDEADDFLAYLNRPGTTDDATSWNGESGMGWMLRSLVNQSRGRFDVRFAGFQEIDRAARDTSGPFFNFQPGASSLPLRVFSASEARMLVERPLNLLSIGFERASLIDRILDYTGCHPSLIQQFCNRLFTLVRSDTDRWTITSRDVDRVFADSDFREQLVNVIHLNVDGATRSKQVLRLVLYLWIEHLVRESEVKHKEIYSTQELYDLLCEWKPGAESVIRSSEIDAYMRDLVVLGVLRQEPGGYTLANRYFASLLHSERYSGSLSQAIDSLWSQLTEGQDVKDRSLLPDDHDVLSIAPLTRQQQDLLQNSRQHVSFVVGPTACGKQRLCRTLLSMDRARAPREFPEGGLVVHGAQWNSDADALAALSTAIFKKPVKTWGRFLDAANTLGTGIDHDKGLMTVVVLGTGGLSTNSTPLVEWSHPHSWSESHGLLDALVSISANSGGALRFVIMGTRRLARFLAEWGPWLPPQAPVFDLRRLLRNEINQWVAACNFEASGSTQELIYSSTGGDLRLLHDLASTLRNGKGHGEIEVTCQDVHDFSAILEGTVVPPSLTATWDALQGCEQEESMALNLLGQFSIEFNTQFIGVAELDYFREWISLRGDSSDNLLTRTYSDWEIWLRTRVYVHDLLPPANSGALARIDPTDPWFRLVSRQISTSTTPSNLIPS